MKPKTILVADDSPTIVEIMKFMLGAMGYHVEVATDGIEAIERAYAVHPDLILLDIEMPKMNGYQVCRLLKADRATSQIPVVILTSRDLAADRFWGMATGADEYVVKDLEDESLFDRIQQLLEESAERERPAELVTQDISEVGVLEQVNALLDSRLFQSTIVNELGSLAVKMMDFEETVSAVLDLLAKVVDFAVAVLVLRDPPDSYARLHVNSAVTPEALAEVRRRVAEENSRHGLVVDLDRAVESSSAQTRRASPRPELLCRLAADEPQPRLGVAGPGQHARERLWRRPAGNAPHLCPRGGHRPRQLAALPPTGAGQPRPPAHHRRTARLPGPRARPAPGGPRPQDRDRRDQAQKAGRRNHRNGILSAAARTGASPSGQRCRRVTGVPSRPQTETPAAQTTRTAPRP